MYQYKSLYTIDFSNTKYYLEFHKAIQKALDFPDYYGCNLSALWDCLTDMVGRPLHIRIFGLEVIERNLGSTAEEFTDLLKEFKHYDNDRYRNEIIIEIARGKTYIELV